MPQPDLIKLKFLLEMNEPTGKTVVFEYPDYTTAWKVVRSKRNDPMFEGWRFKLHGLSVTARV